MNLIPLPVTYALQRGHACVPRDLKQHLIEDLLRDDWGAFSDTLESPEPQLLPAHFMRKPKRQFRQGRVGGQR